MLIDVLTLFPGMFNAFIEESITGRAVKSGIIDISVRDIRAYSANKHNKTDDYPFGGGAGMLLNAEPIFRAIDAMENPPKRKLYMSPKGRRLDADILDSLSGESSLLILCGHYEGVDERVIEHFDFEEVSIGDYILTGGELPAMVLIDALLRLLPGALGSESSHDEESVYSGLLEYPQYTKPRVFEGLEVPEVLYSGNHEKIRLWQLEQSLSITAERRPDLFDKYDAEGLSKAEAEIYKRVKRQFRGNIEE